MSLSARYFFALLAVLALTLGILGFRQYLPGHPEHGRGFLDLVYYSLQLFVLDAAPLQTAKNLPVTLQIARFAAPAVTVYLLLLATQALIVQRLTQIRISTLRNHSILCGPPELTRRLAEQIRSETGGKAVVVGDRGRTQLRPMHLVGDPRNRLVLERAGLRRARELIAVGPDSVRNAEVAIAVHAANRAGNTAVTCYAEAQDRELFHEVVRQEVGSDDVSRLDVFDRHDRTARALLDDPGRAVLVIGYAGLGRVVVDRLMRLWSAGNDPAGLCVLDSDVPAEVVRTRHIEPHGKITVSARRTEPAWLTTVDELQVPTGDGSLQVPNTVYVCLADDADGIAAGDAVLRLLAEHETTVVVAVTRSSVVGSRVPRVLGKARLVLVNVMRTVYSMAAIRTGTNEQLAQAIHETYVQHAKERGESPATNDSIRPWGELPEYLRDSNREQAWDIGHKLGKIGFSAVSAGGSARPVQLSDDDVEKLARMEHRRWVAERTAKGWRHGSTRDNDRKLHPDLVEWEYLSDDSKDKDRSAVRAIPGHLARAGLTIVRVEHPSA